MLTMPAARIDGLHAEAVRRIRFILGAAKRKTPPGWPLIVLEATLAGASFTETIKAFGDFCKERRNAYDACHLYLGARR
ncbi:MAG: hypothetical protein HYU59_05695 [Magnetospirillum gryphiswaldense]|nr:hypothetical protein [Magnetospirillum gryphiswaldense]